MNSQPPPIGCIDGRVVTVRFDADEVILAFEEARARLSVEAAKRLAAQLSPPSQSAHSSSKLANSEEPTPKKPSGSWDSVMDLIKADLLKVGTVIAMTYRGEEYSATITSRGDIEIDGVTVDSPSAASRHVTKTSRNGWADWRTEDGSPLSDLRWRLRAQSFPDDDHSYSDSTIAEKRRIAGRWVRYCLNHKLDPDKRDADTVSGFLSSHDFAESTLASYRRHLDQWFEQYDSSE